MSGRWFGQGGFVVVGQSPRRYVEPPRLEGFVGWGSGLLAGRRCFVVVGWGGGLLGRQAGVPGCLQGGRVALKRKGA